MTEIHVSGEAVKVGPDEVLVITINERYDPAIDETDPAFELVEALAEIGLAGRSLVINSATAKMAVVPREGS